MEPEKIQAIKDKFAEFKAIEDTLTPEQKKDILTEINTLVMGLNQDIEEYLVKMKQIEVTQKFDKGAPSE